MKIKSLDMRRWKRGIDNCVMIELGNDTKGMKLNLYMTGRA
jgi:hypothetical protein